MSLVSDSRKCAQRWFDLAECLPLKERQAALDIPEAWFQLAMDAAALDAGQKHPPAAKPHNIHYVGKSMSERATTRMFGWSLGGNRDAEHSVSGSNVQHIAGR